MNIARGLLVSLYLLGLASVRIEAQSFTEPSLQIFSNTSSKTGMERIQDLSGEGNHASLLYFSQDIRLRFSEFGQGPRLGLGYHFEIDLEKDDQEELLQENLDRLTLAIDQPYSLGEYGVGLKILSWGETASLPILDLTNPRNVGHPRGFYDSSAKISVPMVTGSLNTSYVQISSFLSFWPKSSRLPEEVGGFVVRKPEEKNAFEDYEGGLRVGTTMSNLDVKLHYIKHQARIPSFNIMAFADNGDLTVNQKKIDTFGLSFSWAGFEHLFRGDIRYSNDHPVNGVMQKVIERDLLQSIIGYDYSPNINTIIGLEAHYDDWGLIPYHFVDGPWAASSEDQAKILWIGTNTRINFFNNLLETRFLYLKGIENNDMLARLKLEVKPSSMMTLSLEAQKISFKASSPRYVLSEQERILFGIDFFI